MTWTTKRSILRDKIAKLISEKANRPKAEPGHQVSRENLFGALDGAAVSIPIALGSVALVYAKFPPEYLSYGVLVTLLALMAVHAVSALGSRPSVFSARLVEAGTLASMLDQFTKYMPVWGVDMRPQALLALMCVLGVVAFVVCMLLFLLRADRFTRLIPTPVYSGFTIAIAILLLMSQSNALWQLWHHGHSAAALLSICAAALVACLVSQRFTPRWPATAIGIFVGTAGGLLWWVADTHVAMMVLPGQSMQLPWDIADFSALLDPKVQTAQMLSSLVSNGILLGLVLFINMTVANETVSQLDDRYASGLQHAGIALSGALGCAVGAMPIGPSQQAALATMRGTRLSGFRVFMVGLLCAAVGLSGSLQWIPIAAVAVAMVCNAFFQIDPSVVKQGWQWLRGAQLLRSQKEDVTLVATVIFAMVVFNAVVAVFTGLLFGLLLFAVRNAKQPVRYQWTGAQVSSNCSRGRYELRVLAKHGTAIKVLELDSELFFGAVSSLDESLEKSLELAQAVILDWSRVRHVDSSIATSLQRWQRAAQAADVYTLHAGATLQGGNAAAFLEQYLPQANLLPDVDRALEVAENIVIEHWGTETSVQATATYVVLPVFNNMTAQARDQVRECMQQRLYKEGEVVFNEGDASDSMLIVVEGSASVIVRNAQSDIRVNSVRRGGVIGELGFIDGAPRSATVVTQEDMLVYVLTRTAFDKLRVNAPNAVYELMFNIALELAARVRYTTRQAVARSELT